MKDLPTPEAIRARVDETMTPERRRRALDWAKTPEGRAALREHAEQFARMPKPVDPRAPENVAVPLHSPAPAPSRGGNLGGVAAVAAWWLLAAIAVAGWLYAVDRWPQLWGTS